MKTFKLKTLDIIQETGKDIIKDTIPLLDGLIINREDEQNRWVIEAYMSHSHFDYFNQLKEDGNTIMVQVKITKKNNAPATFITTIISINEIGDYMNILLMGTIVDRRKNIIENMLKKLIDEGYQGEELLLKFKEKI